MMPIGFSDNKAIVKGNSDLADLVGTFDDADAGRLAALQQSLVIQRARAANSMREESRLVDKYGKESPQALEAAARVTSAREMLARLVADTARAGVAWFDVPDGASIVHGFVIDADFKGLAVELLVNDQQGNIAGRTKTDGRGYFQVSFQISEKPDNQGTLAEGSTVRLTVLESGKPTQADDQDLPLGSGRAIYREIVLVPEAPPPIIR